MFTEVNISLNAFPIYIQKIITEVFGSRWKNIKLCEYSPTLNSPFSEYYYYNNFFMLK